MFFYSESIETILSKQNLSAYIEAMILGERSGRKVMPSPKLVQVVTVHSVSDGEFDYPCIFTSEKMKKGSYLRLTKWEVNTRSCELAIHEAQYLGGAGCEVKHGKRWDSEKLKQLTMSKVLSKHFVILHEPSFGVEDRDYPKFEYAAISKAMASKRASSEQKQTKQTFEKMRKSYEQGPSGKVANEQGNFSAMEEEQPSQPLQQQHIPAQNNAV